MGEKVAKIALWFQLTTVSLVIKRLNALGKVAQAVLIIADFYKISEK